jgi:DNA-directed RNA polymerase omega subunit
MDNDRMSISYQVVLAAAERAKQLTAGAKPRISEQYPKHTFTALEEVLQNKINFKFYDEDKDNSDELLS